MHNKINTSEIVFYINSNKEMTRLVVETTEAAKTVLCCIHIFNFYLVVEKRSY